MRKRIKLLCLLLCKAVLLQGEMVEIVSNMYTEEILSPSCFTRIKEMYQVRIVDQKYHVCITKDDQTVKRYLVFNDHNLTQEIPLCPEKKKVLFVMEPDFIPDEVARSYSRIYTWDDDAIDGKKFFKLYFPDLAPMRESLLPFEDRKLCTMVVRNWVPEHRKQMVAFFANKPKGEFFFYGSPLPKLCHSKLYKGRIDGLNCGQEKIDVLNGYRFCLCFENKVGLRGYISEKIFSCFAAGCIPIYFGAPNIAEYIPKECFIDYRDFKDNEELYQFIKAMPKDTYQQYLAAIRNFLISKEAFVFSPSYFAQILYEASAWE